MRSRRDRGPAYRPLLTHDVLPPAGFGVGGDPENRWTVARKAAVVRAVCSGQVVLSAVQAAYRLSVEEFLTWAADFTRGGHVGLGQRAIVARRPPDRRYRRRGQGDVVLLGSAA